MLSPVQGPHDGPVLPAGPDDGVADGADPAQVCSYAAVLHLKVGSCVGRDDFVEGREYDGEQEHEGPRREGHLVDSKLPLSVCLGLSSLSSIN